jgi:excisionase family DNA binding protein
MRSGFDRVAALFYTCVTYLGSLVWLQGPISFPLSQKTKAGVIMRNAAIQNPKLAEDHVISAAHRNRQIQDENAYEARGRLHPVPSPSSEMTPPPKRTYSRYSSLPEPLIDSEEAAAIIGIHPKTLQKMARRGQIRGVHVGKLWRFRASTIEEWIARELAS